MMKAMPDQRKFIRDIKGLIKNGAYSAFFEDQKQLAQVISEKFAATEIRSKEDIDRFAAENPNITEELQMSMERALLRSRSQQLREKPSEHVSKCISLLLDVDPRLFGKMNTEERESLKASLDELTKIVDGFRSRL